MVTKIIHSKAPTRIDLAGGTLDIWPLYLFLKDPVTLNLGIDLFAEAKIELSSSQGSGQNAGRIRLKSEDQNSELEFTWNDLKQKTISNPPRSLELHFKLLKYFYEKKGLANQNTHLENSTDFTLSTRANSPAGAGLGGSSTLSIAMIGALSAWAENSTPENSFNPLPIGERLIEIVRDIETTVIQVPAGLQDYYAAMFGGLQCLRWGAGAHQRDVLSNELIPELQDRLLLFYSGQPRNSGINNWALFKGFIDNQDHIQSRFAEISQATQQLEKALRARNWVEAGQAIQAEWAIRKTLAPGISTPEMDRAFSEASKLAPVSGKVCGAGGGGCFFVYLPVDSTSERAELKTRIQELFTAQGIRPLPFQGVPRGLEVRVTRA
jgi:D-glycero-alpha-D-manno-heptose-7-phosphate kinase